MATDGTRQRILDAALRSFLADGYEQTTVAHIRELSGVSNGALFHHFASKEALADALFVQAIASFHEGLWDLLARRPRSLRAAVAGTIEHQLGWVQDNRDLARFVYMRGHLDWGSSGASEVARLNEAIGAAFERWMEPLIERGEVRAGSMLLISAIVNGPAHAIARRWLAGHLDRPPIDYAPELADAATAALGGPLAPLPRRARSPRRGRVTVELLADDGSVAASGIATTELSDVRPLGSAHGR
jgi:AcrR family transcriptional regulator